MEMEMRKMQNYARASGGMLVRNQTMLCTKPHHYRRTKLRNRFFGWCICAGVLYIGKPPEQIKPKTCHAVCWWHSNAGSIFTKSLITITNRGLDSECNQLLISLYLSLPHYTIKIYAQYTKWIWNVQNNHQAPRMLSQTLIKIHFPFTSQ